MGTLSTMLPILTSSNPAAGAAISEVIIATSAAAVLTVFLFGGGLAYRNGGFGLLRRFAAATERHSGLPAWAEVPGIVSGISLIVALLGMYWDISLHIDNGRDPGPLANPAHY